MKSALFPYSNTSAGKEPNHKNNPICRLSVGTRALLTLSRPLWQNLSLKLWNILNTQKGTEKIIIACESTAGLTQILTHCPTDTSRKEGTTGQVGLSVLPSCPISPLLFLTLWFAIYPSHVLFIPFLSLSYIHICICIYLENIAITGFIIYICNLLFLPHIM